MRKVSAKILENDLGAQGKGRSKNRIPCRGGAIDLVSTIRVRYHSQSIQQKVPLKNCTARIGLSATCLIVVLAVASPASGTRQEEMRQEKKSHDGWIRSVTAEIRNGTSPEIYLSIAKQSLETAGEELQRQEADKRDALLHPNYYGQGYVQSLEGRIAVLRYRVQLAKEAVRIVKATARKPQAEDELPLPPRGPPDDVANQLAPEQAQARLSVLEQIGQLIQQVPEDLATKRAAEYIFGKGIAKLAGKGSTVASALESEVAADGTRTGPVKMWRNKCRDYVADYRNKQTEITKALRLEQSILAKLSNNYLSPADRANLRQNALSLNETTRSEMEALKTRQKALNWCKAVQKQADHYLDVMEN